MPWDHQSLGGAEQYGATYFNLLGQAARSIDVRAIGRAARMLDRAIEARQTIYACGNGGSAAVSNHLHCDFLKGIQTDTGCLPAVVSLSANIETITAISNDIEYAEVFVYPLRTMARPGDVLITISSSGNSENVVRAVRWAREHGLGTIALTGFSGGRTAELADINVHVAMNNYGVVEDLHQSIMHIFAQFLREKRLSRSFVVAGHVSTTGQVK